MTNPLPQSNVLAAIGAAVATSVICTWTISTHFQSQTQREFDRIHSRLDSMVGRVDYARAMPVDSDASGEVWAAEAWDMPEAPEAPAGEEP